MASKLMQRKQRWARAYAAEQDAKIKAIRGEQRKLFGADSDDAKRARRELALVRAVIEADRAFQVIAIRDMRSPANKGASSRAYKRLDRAEKALLGFYDFDFDRSAWRYGQPTLRDLMEARIDELLARIMC